jgi:hypothetical protein
LILRIAIVPSAHWTDDETGMYVSALGVASGQYFPVFGPPITSTVARLPGPAVHYFDAFALFLGRGHPYAIGIALSLLQLAGIALFVWALWEAVSPVVATLLACLLCFGPWPVLFCDRPMNTHHALAATLLIGGTVTLGLLRRHALLQGLAAALLVIVPQLHLSGLLLGAALMSLALVSFLSQHGAGPEPDDAGGARTWVARLGLHHRAIALGAAAGFLTYVPGMVWELTHDFSNTRAFFGRATGDGRDAWEWARSLVGPLFFSSNEIGWFALRGYWIPTLDPVLYAKTDWLREHLVKFYGATLPLVLGSVLVSLAAHARALRCLLEPSPVPGPAQPGRARMDVDPWTLAYLVIVVSAAALLVASRKIYFPHYNVIALPLTAVMVARLLAAVAGRGRGWQAAVIGWTAAASLAGVVVAAQYYRRVDSASGLDTQRRIVATICQRQQGRPFKLTFASDVYPSYAAQEVFARQRRCRWDAEGGGPVRYHIEGIWTPPPKAPPGKEIRMDTYGAARLVMTAPPGDAALSR